MQQVEPAPDERMRRAVNDMNTAASRVSENVTVAGNQVVERIRQLIAAGNVRHVTVRHAGRVVAEFPLTVGVVATLLAPQLAALGLLAALFTQCTIEVIRVDQPTPT